MGIGECDVRPPPEDIPDELRQWLMDLWLFVNAGNIKVYNQNAEPTIGDNQIALWIDADGGPAYYLVANFDGTQKTVALT